MLFILPLLALSQVGLPKGQTPKPVPSKEKVVLRVNNVSIKAAEVNALLWDWYREEVIQDLIAYQAAMQEAAAKKIVVTEAEIQTKVSERMKQAQVSPETLSQQGFPKSRIYLRVKVEALFEKIAIQELQPEDYIKVKMLLIRPSGTSAEALTAAAKLAEDASAKLVAGEGWSKVYGLYGAKDNMLATQGAIGWRQYTEFGEQAAQVLKKVEKGKSTTPIKVPLGWQIFLVEAKGDKLSTTDRNDLYQSVLPVKMGAIAERIRQSTKIYRGDR